MLYPNTEGNHRNASQEPAADRSRDTWEVGRGCSFQVAELGSRKLQTELSTTSEVAKAGRRRDGWTTLLTHTEKQN